MKRKAKSGDIARFWWEKKSKVVHRRKSVSEMKGSKLERPGG